MDMNAFSGKVDFDMQRAKATIADNSKIAKSAEDFEGMFMGEMVSIMFEGVGDDSMFSGGQGEKMFQSLLTQEYGKAMAKGNGTGIAGEMQKMMLKIQEQQQQQQHQQG